MSGIFSSSSGNSTTNSNSQSDPWDVTIPFLSQFIKDLDSTRSLAGPTGDQLDAFAQLKQRAAGGNPYAPAIGALATDQLGGVPSRSGAVTSAYDALKAQLGDVASGKNLDIMSNPQIQAMLANVGNDAQNRVNSLFAAAGRPISGNVAGQVAMGKGITEAQLPILFNEYARQQGRTDAAARDLNTAGTSAATTAQGLDANALAGRAAGVDTAGKAIDAANYGDNTILNLDQQLKSMPTTDLANYESLLLPVSGLGGQQQGTSNTKSSQTGFSLGASLFSDERVKDNIEKVGETDDGQPIYRFQYKGDPTWHMGLIAQEVEKVKPDAVGEAGGIKTVNIKRATDGAVKAEKKGAY